MQKLGLTGNICAGKSQVEAILEKKGYKVIDLDKISHKFLENNEEIKNHFKTLDRKIIAGIVFSDSSEKKFLESIIHPLLYNYILEEFKKDYEKIVISGALLYEAGFDKLFDKIFFVDAPYDTRLERLMKRNNLSQKEAEKRLQAQNTNYKNHADYIIENNSSLDDLEKTINSIL
ncbi:MAG: dephospho-CoA kinase [Candidatus Gastranaerophilales bacterium]|nr:dephospho-CoA kinase [Candidatus Gastranaerophilales bacterium]